MEPLPPSEKNPNLINGYSINYVHHSIGKFLVETKMDSPVLFDIWKYEKSKAARFMKKLMLLEMLVSLVLIISWSWTQLPAAVKSSGALLVELSGYLCNTHSVFLFCNGIVLALFLLCRQTDISRNSVINGCGGSTQLMMSASEIFAPLPQPETAAEDSRAGEEETIKTVCLESVVSKPQCNEVATAAIENVRKQIQTFQRIESAEKWKQEVALQRQSRSCVESRAIENLNNEEFRRRIEKFIRKNHEMFKVEKERGDESMKQQNMNINSLQIISL